MKLHLSYFSVLLLIAIVISVSCNREGDPIIIKTLPSATTDGVTWIRSDGVTLNGTVNARNLNTLVYFEYGTDTAFYSNIIDATEDPIITNIDTAISIEITGLAPNTIYYYRIGAENQEGEAYGTRKSFLTLNEIYFNPDITYGTVTDYEGNIYNTVEIGEQTWMAENLRSTTFNDGTPIDLVTDHAAWTVQENAGYSWYKNNSDFFGSLYNWHVVGAGILCPTGWHIPTDDEWNILIDYFGGEDIAGNKLKEPGVIHWSSLNSLSTNESGFTALPGGYRNYIGTFAGMKQLGYWWTGSSGTDDTYAFYRSMAYNHSSVNRNLAPKKSGFSVRCLQDD